MDNAQILTALQKIFDDGHRIVFWHDPEREFELLLGSLELPQVNILRLDHVPALAVKIKLELDDPNGRYLLYSPLEEPNFEDDWLLDIRLYSRLFWADRASIILNDLGLKSLSLRDHVAQRHKFFDNKDRVKKLQGIVAPSDNAVELDRKMLAVLLKADQPEPFTLVRAIYQALVDSAGENAVDLGMIPPVWELVGKFELELPFWQMAKETFGYEEQIPSLKNLLIRLMVTDFAKALKGDIPQALTHLLLPGLGAANAVVFLAQWRDSASQAETYDRLAAAVSDEIKIENLVGSLDLSALLEAMTFLVVEKEIVRAVRDRVIATADTAKPDEIKEIAGRRLDGHWASTKFAQIPAVPRTALRAVYGTLVAASEFFDLKNKHTDGFDFVDAKAFFDAYGKELFRFDQLYRTVCEKADIANREGWSILKDLLQAVEDCYGNWFLSKLALAWGKLLDPQSSTGLMRTWKLDGVPNQYDFFNQYIVPRLKESDNRRVFVVVSDALRYEVAEEVNRELSGTYRLQSELTPMLGVLPSYTALGMASLLPHKRLEYRDGGDVLVDGMTTAGLSARSEILSMQKGIAVNAEDLLAMRKEDGREFVRNKQVVYVYHGTIDNIGDKAATESKTFEACRDAIREISDLVRHIVNNLNGTLVYVTADHGFLFKEMAPAEPEKSPLGEQPPGTVIAKKRYLIGRRLPDNAAAWHGSTKTTAQADPAMEFWIPKGINRFHFVGGARFIHGGAMPQEIMIPVLTVRQIKGKGAEETKIRKVSVQVLGSMQKITASRHRFNLLQIEPVSDRVRPVTLKVAVYDGSEPVTNVETVTFDSLSSNMEERSRWVNVVLKDRQYDKRKPYRLILRDAETEIEEQSIQVTIDRAISDDF